MAIYRMIQMKFWEDGKVADDFTPEDKYFYLYLMTNPHTNLCGCYEIIIRQMANESGYSRETVEKLLRRFEEVHEVIKYSKKTKEILLLNWFKYNWTSSEKFKKPLLAEITEVKNKEFRRYLDELVNKRYGIDTTDAVSDADTDADAKSDAVILNEFFESIWSLYPVKKGKGSVSKTQKQKLQKIGYDQIKRCVDRYVEELRAKHTDEKFWKNGSTFFNSGYVDYLDENYEEKTPRRPMTYREQVANSEWQ